MTRRRLLVYVSIFILMVTLICVVGLVYFNDQAVLQSDYLKQTKDDQMYYRHLSRECLKRDSVSCCMTSLRRMMAHHAREASPEGCAEGFQPNMLRCIDSFRWCEKKNGQ